MSMMGVREPSVHIGSQYIHIYWIWQAWLSSSFESVCRERHHLISLVNAFNVSQKT